MKTKCILVGIILLSFLMPTFAAAQKCGDWLDFQCWRSRPAGEWRAVVPETVNRRIDFYLLPAQPRQAESINIGLCICEIYSLPEKGCPESLVLEEYFFCLPEPMQKFILMFYQACP